MNKLYVGNLDYGTTGEQLEELFSQAGKVISSVVISDRQTGRSKGFAFVEMSTDEEAKKAITMFNDQELEGRKMTVNEARPMQPRQDFRPRGNFQPRKDY